MTKAAIELLANGSLAVSFPYHAGRVASIKCLASRKWNPAQKRWEVHLSHLGQLLEILELDEADLPDGLMENYRGQWGGADARIELDVLRGKLSGGRLPIAELDEAASFFVPGYKFSPKFKSREWDGRKHLFNARAMTFPAGLWPRLAKVLEQSGLRVEVSGGERPTTRKGAGESRLGAQTPPTPLRDYQRKALMQALRAGRGVIQIPTGGGKTLLAAHLIHAIDLPTLFFVHTRDLLHQSAAVFERELGIEIGILGDGQASLRPLTVATVQTLFRALEGIARPRGAKRPSKTEEEAIDDEAPLDLDEATRAEVVAAVEGAGLIIFDECHHLPADSFFRIAMQARSAAWRFGLSATPWRDDRQDMLLEAALGPSASVTRFSDLIELGHLTPPRIRIARTPPPKLAGMRRMAYSDLYAMAIVENQERNRAIAAQAAGWAAEGLSVLVLVAQTAHGEILAGLLPEARFVHGGHESAYRRQCLDELERKLRPILIATTLADEGLDVPSLGAVILAGGGKSASRIYQRIGRALRPAPGKSEARVLDFMDDLPYLRQHSEARLELYRQEPCFRIELESVGAPRLPQAPNRKR